MPDGRAPGPGMGRLALMFARHPAIKVWMHLDEQQRRRAIPNLAAVVRSGGVMIMTLRHGPVPPGRRMFEVSAEETIALAAPLGLDCVLNRPPESSLRQPGVSWTRLAFRKEL